MIKLSRRLRLIADKIPEGSRLADIGSDHALLPCFLAEQGRIIHGIAGEINKGPWEAAEQQIRQAQLGHLIQARQGDGLEVISPGDADVISIAGMGGSLIVQILSEGMKSQENLNKLQGVKRLVLQPNVGENQVRKWLFENRWALVDEVIMEEDHKTYEILTADQMDHAEEFNNALYTNYFLDCGLNVAKERLFSMGPYLLRDPNLVFLNKWFFELNKLEYIKQSLTHSALDASKNKIREIDKEIHELREVLVCLQKDRQ